MLIIHKPYIIPNIPCNKSSSGRWTINPMCVLLLPPLPWWGSPHICWRSFPATLAPSCFPQWKGLTLPLSFPEDSSSKAISICHCTCSQGSGRQNGNRRTAEVSGVLLTLQPPRWHPGHHRGCQHSAAGSCLSSPARLAGISPSTTSATALDTPWRGYASLWWSYRTRTQTGSPRSGS